MDGWMIIADFTRDGDDGIRKGGGGSKGIFVKVSVIQY
jgi:hypothetical protein